MTNNINFNDYYIYNFRISLNIFPNLICYNSRTTKTRIILEYIKSLDWTRIDNANLGNYNNIRGIQIFARNWNVLNTMCGAGGLHYRN